MLLQCYVQHPYGLFWWLRNKVTFHVPLQVVSDIRITGRSDPSVLEYNSTAGYSNKYRVEDQLGNYREIPCLLLITQYYESISNTLMVIQL